MEREFTAVYRKSGKWWAAWIEEIPGVNTQGHTKKEARENLKEALALVLQANREIAARTAIGAVRESFRIMTPA